ncbi:MAG: hypothetical protein RR561_01755 [Peptostreptococcus sp.]|uniref:hypothetical protein n=1 Tax=Peptostreptococcus sp. TaxID=1262 RepID=UPI002FC77EDB
MKISELLENLFSIAGVQKTDFAIAMNISPSSLSKILSGKTIPIAEEKNQFSKKAAHFFAESIYEYDCHLKFKNIFPLLYDFRSMYELKVFLIHAIDYALENNYSSRKNDAIFEHNNKTDSFIGRESVLNMACIIISDYYRKNVDNQIEISSSLRLFSQLYYDIFKHIKFTIPKKIRNINYNHFFDLDTFEKTYKNHDFCTVEKIVNSRKSLNLNLFEMKMDSDSSFLLMKGQFLLLFNVLMDGTLLMTFINKDSYLSKFENSLIKKNPQKFSYTRSEAIDILKENPALFENVIKEKIDRIYSFLPLGFLIEKNDFEQINGHKYILDIIMKIFNKVVTEDTDVYISTDAITEFLITGEIVIPLIGMIDIEEKERINYYIRLDKYLNEHNINKVKIVDSKLPKLAFLCAEGLSILYVMGDEYKDEKIHILKTNVFNEVLESKISNGNVHTIELDTVLKDTYLKKFSKKFFDNEIEVENVQEKIIDI